MLVAPAWKGGCFGAEVTPGGPLYIALGGRDLDVGHQLHSPARDLCVHCAAWRGLEVAQTPWNMLSALALPVSW